MVAIVLPQPQQMTLLPPPAPVSGADVVRLAWWIGQLRYGDVLVSYGYRLERQLIQQISDADNDDAPDAPGAPQDGELVSGTYVEFLFFVAGGLFGVVELRTESVNDVRLFRSRLACYLLEHDWIEANTKLVPGGALASPGMRLDRVRRLLKSKG